MSKFLVLFLSFTCALNLFAGELLSKYGSKELVKFRPESSPLDFEYDVLYYIPKDLEGKADIKTLVFLHGGGQSTATRSSSLSVAKMYSTDIFSIADSLGVAAIVPSGSGLNWGGHTISFLEDLNRAIAKTPNFDRNAIGLSGHSMGGMAITRSGMWLADEYAFQMPIAAGMDEKYIKPKYLRPFFDMTYVHLQGLNDHFQIFVQRCEKQAETIDQMEVDQKRDSGFEMIFYEGGHNYNYSQIKSLYRQLFSEVKRKANIKSISGLMYNVNKTMTDQWSYGIEYYKGPRNKYFWLEGLEFKKKETLMEVSGKIEGNNILVKADQNIKKLRVYLSKKTTSLSEKINLKVNGKNYTITDMLGISVNKVRPIRSVMLENDPDFDAYVDITL